MSEVMYRDLSDSGKSLPIPLEIGMYPDGMPIITRDYDSVYEILLRPYSLHTFTTTMFWVDALRARGDRKITLKLPLVPGSRQDRLNIEGDQLFTLKSVAEMINQRNFDRVVIHDPHSDVTPALINNVQIYRAVDIIGQLRFRNMGPYNGVIAPDAGAAKRAGDVATKFGVPLYQAWKRRDIATGKLNGFGCELLKSGRYLIVDDICDGGGTFNGLYDHINSSPARYVIDLYVTHGIFSQGTTELKKRFDNIYTTDSTLYNKEGCTVFNL